MLPYFEKSPQWECLFGDIVQLLPTLKFYGVIPDGIGIPFIPPVRLLPGFVYMEFCELTLDLKHVLVFMGS